MSTASSGAWSTSAIVSSSPTMSSQVLAKPSGSPSSSTTSSTLASSDGSQRMASVGKILVSITLATLYFTFA